MEITLLIKSIVGLVSLLAVLIFLLLWSSNKKKDKKNKIKTKKQDIIKHDITDLQTLRAIIKNKKTSSTELAKTLDLILKYHGNIHKKLGVRTHPDFDTYMDILFTICKHPNTNKDIIVKFDRELNKLNPEYAHEINDAITKGLNSRGL